jgi:DtxR family Mn-dependent transcriptional regulator
MMVSARHSAADAASREPAYTGPVEDYLKAIYELERVTGVAATTDIARRLTIAPPSVTWMVRRLAKQGLLTYERYRGVHLTKTGQRTALRILRRHRVIETFLAHVLGFPWDEVHAEAERLEHAASDALVDRMAAALDEPTVDPHGAPIPTRDGTVVEPRYESIVDLTQGEHATVVLVSDDDAARLRHLATLGLVPGAPVVVTDRAPFDGPITIQVGSGRHAIERRIGPALGRGVLVRANRKNAQRPDRTAPGGRRPRSR